MSPSFHFDSRLAGIVEESARSLGYSTHGMISGAGHDAGYMSMITAPP